MATKRRRSKADETVSDEIVAVETTGVAVAEPETEDRPTETGDSLDTPPEDEAASVSEANEDVPAATDEEMTVLSNEMLNYEGDEANAALDAMVREESLAPYQSTDGRVEPIPYGVTLVPGKKVRAKVYTLKLSDIARDSRIQPRDKMNDEVIRDYAESMRDGVTFPAVVVFREENQDGIINWLADGWHRVYAAERAELPSIRAEVYAGDINAATLFAAGANSDHGLRRTNADKIRSVEMILNHPLVIEQQWADNRIAKQAGVSHVTVGNVRRRLHPDDNPTHRLGADGRVHNVRHRLESRGASDGEAAQPTLYPCKIEDCPEVTAVPSVHCADCGDHYPTAEYDTCPTCHPSDVDTGNGHAPVVATVVDEPLPVDEEPVDLPDHGGSLPPIGETHAALRALVVALDRVEEYTTTLDPSRLAVIVDEDAIEALLDRLKAHLDWVDGVEQGLKARQPTPATV